MSVRGYVLATNNTGAAATSPIIVQGGRMAIIISATVYPATCKLQVLGPDDATYIDINATAYSANQVTAYDLPSGQYRLNLAGGTVAALYAKLVSIPYS